MKSISIGRKRDLKNTLKDSLNLESTWIWKGSFCLKYHFVATYVIHFSIEFALEPFENNSISRSGTVNVSLSSASLRSSSYPLERLCSHHGRDGNLMLEKTWNSNSQIRSRLGSPSIILGSPLSSIVLITTNSLYCSLQYFRETLKS